MKVKVEEVMTRDVKSCAPDTDLAAAVKMMWDNDCGALPVVDERDRAVGMITDRDSRNHKMELRNFDECRWG